MKTPRIRGLAAAMGLGAALVAGVALAQPAPPPPPAGAQPGQPAQPGQVQVRKIDPSELPPQFRQPGGPAAPGGPMAPGARPLPPGMRPPGAPGGLPPGFNPRRPVAPPAHAAHGAHAEAEESGHGAHEHCPGHGPSDPPPPVNWWRGLLMVNNERAKSDSFVDKLLFRYENTNDPCDKDNLPPPFLASVFNFAILGFILYKFGRKPLAEALVKRKTTIMAEIDTATKLKEDAELRLEEYEDKFERMDETLSELRAELAAQSEQEKKHILAEAEERRVRMLRDAEFRIEQEGKAARAELLQQAIVGAAVAAEELLVKKVGPSDLDLMAEDYLKAVGPAIKGPSMGVTAPGGR
ncbi:MAG: F0F1 ATP synthase subunit B [Byssovorax sp.]